MMDIGKDLQDAYERGRQDAWDIAQKVFNSTVTLYEAEDVAKQIAKNESQNHSGEVTEMVKPQTDDGTAFIKRHGLRVDYGNEVPYDLKPFIDW